MKTLDLTKLIKELKKSDFYLNSGIPLEYTCGLPVFETRSSGLCVKIPFLKYKVTGVVDKTLVFPVRYVITVSLPEKKCVAFEDLSYNNIFRKVDFSKPVGYFRHDAIKTLDKKEYKEKRAELFSLYDKIIATILSKNAVTEEDKLAFSELLNIMIEPSLKPIYKVLSADFYDKYLS